MKKLILALALTASVASSYAQDVPTLRKDADGTTIINTYDLSAKVMGYNGPTPIEVYIKDGKIQKVVSVENYETPKFYRRVEKELFPKFAGMDVKKALKKLDVDAVSGATLSSKAIIENVKLALQYYKKHNK